MKTSPLAGKPAVPWILIDSQAGGRLLQGPSRPVYTGATRGIRLNELSSEEPPCPEVPTTGIEKERPCRRHRHNSVAQSAEIRRLKVRPAAGRAAGC
jgi:hypothetical protein